MAIIQTIEVANVEGITTTFVIIDRGNGEYTSMPKSVYDEQQAQAKHFTPSLENGTIS